MNPMPFTRGRPTDTTPVPVRTESVRVGLFAIVLVWLIRHLTRTLILIIRTPLLLAISFLIIGLVILRSWAGSWFALAVVLTVVGSLVGWRLRWPGSFTLILGNRARSLGRRFWTYRRFWQPAMVTANLAQHRDGTEYLPQLLAVSSSRWVDRVRVRLLPGQTIADWADMAHRLAQSFAVEGCRIHSTRDVQVIEIWALRRDPLTDPIQPVQPDRLDLDGLEVGRVEDGSPFRLGLLGHHVLVVGATGSGKGSVTWSMISQLAPGLDDDTVRLWVIDPKGGMELAPGAPLFDRFAHGTATGPGPWEEDFADLLEDAVAVMRDRQEPAPRRHPSAPADTW